MTTPGARRSALLLALILTAPGCDSASAPGRADAGVEVLCFPSCAGRECGDDGCGGSCGVCPGGTVCLQGTCDRGETPPLQDTTEEPDAPAAEDASDTGTAPPDSGAPESTDPDGPQPDAPPLPDDGDGDGVADEEDNCPTMPNPSQMDSDGDHKGNVCDLDDDGDGDPDDTDCGALDPFVGHLVSEACDGLDQDCDGVADEDFPDLDGDGTADCMDVDTDGDLDPDGTDCKPLDPDIHHGAVEACNDKDDDCDGAVDPLGSLGCKPVYSDMDSDGFGFAYLLCSCEGAAPGQNQSELPGDCDDGDPDMSPWMLEYCDDRDNNCNGALDEGCDDDGDWWCDMQLPVDGTPDVCPYGSGDCLDMLNHANPAAEELAADGLDNDCDGETDEVVAALVFSCPPGCVGNTLPVYLCAMEMCFDQFIVSSAMSSPTNDNISTAWAAVSHFGSPANDLAPLAGDSYSLLASGPATGTFHSQDLPGGTSISDPFANDGFSTHDNVELNVTLTAPPTATGFAMDYIFFSEEYEEYIGSSFNDKFYIILKAPVTTSNVKKVINFTACSNPGSYWDFIDPGGQKVCYIAINTAFSEPCSNVQTDISGTGFQCGGGGSSNGSSTGWLTTEWSIQAGETFTLTFHIHDASDGIYDSEVILDNFHWLQGDVDEGTKPHF